MMGFGRSITETARKRFHWGENRRAIEMIGAENPLVAQDL
jgi:hypothetical protein